MSSWVKGLGLAIVIVSILEMLLPNNKTKKYIRMIMGIYVLFTIISPFINQKEAFSHTNLDLESYETTQTTSSNLDQSSIDERIQQLYIQELEKDITKKLKEKGYETTTCKVKAQISDKEEETKITKIKIKVQKIVEDNTKPQEEQNLENKIVTEIQKIKPIDTNLNREQEDKEEVKEQLEEKSSKVNKADIQNIKKFLIEEYGVNEKCLEIN